MVRGQLVIAVPALPPHADRHCELDYVIRAHVAPGYISSSDMLTRAGPGSEFATDTSVRKAGLDPGTGTRYLEELAFEVVSTQSKRDVTIRAEDLTARGVRRLLAIFVKQAEVREWSPSKNDWVTLPLDGKLEDPTLARPVELKALLDAAAADDAVVDALDTDRRAHLLALDASGLEQLLAKLESERRWPLA
jgi:hypothetical protein